MVHLVYIYLLNQLFKLFQLDRLANIALEKLDHAEMPTNKWVLDESAYKSNRRGLSSQEIEEAGGALRMLKGDRPHYELNAEVAEKKQVRRGMNSAKRPQFNEEPFRIVPKRTKNISKEEQIAVEKKMIEIEHQGQLREYERKLKTMAFEVMELKLKNRELEDANKLLGKPLKKRVCIKTSN